MCDFGPRRHDHCFWSKEFFMGGTKIVKDLHSEEMSGVILRGVPKYNRLTHTLIAFGKRCFL